ncbi:hypothetical protein JW721_01640 [Candidatus Micrarchaeota archaeon]|nr:hypothetical protein [Candidatus Micrarchaeota archaeon]
MAGKKSSSKKGKQAAKKKPAKASMKKPSAKEPAKKAAARASKSKMNAKAPKAKKATAARGSMLPKIPAKSVKEVDKKLVEWRKSLMAPAERAMIEFFHYPVAKNRGEKQAAKRVIVESYLKGDEVVKQFILFLIHEQLSRAAGLRAMHNFAHFRKAMPKEAEAGEVRKAVYRTMFNYTTSLEGLTELIEFLGELGDEGAAKLLSYHLSYYSSMDNPAHGILRSAVADALGECSCAYALDVLISQAKYGERPGRAIYALSLWEKKLPKSKLSEKEKKEYSREIAKIMGKKERHEYYR